MERRWTPDVAGRGEGSSQGEAATADEVNQRDGEGGFRMRVCPRQQAEVVGPRFAFQL